KPFLDRERFREGKQFSHEQDQKKFTCQVQDQIPDAKEKFAVIKAVPFLQGIQKLQGMSLDLHITQPAGNDSQQNGHHDRIDHGKLVKQGGISLSKGSGVRCAQAPCKPEEQDSQKSQRTEPDEASSQLLLFCIVLAGKIS